MTQTRAFCHLLHGDDPSLVSARTSELLAELDTGDLSIQPVPNESSTNDLMNMLCTPSLFSPEQVVVARSLKAVDTGVIEAASRWVASHMEGTTLVLSFAGKAPAELVKEVKEAGGVIENLSIPANQNMRKGMLEEMVSRSGLRLDARSRALIAEMLGEELGRLPALLDLLKSQFGAEPVPYDAVEPLVGQAGGVPMWDLTDAIDAGDAKRTLMVLERLLQAGKAPVQLLVVVSNHFERMFRVRASGLTNEKDAAAFLGIKGSTFPAKKAIEKSKAWGDQRLGLAMGLLAQAATDVRGGSSLPAPLLLEVLVARLATLRRT